MTQPLYFGVVENILDPLQCGRAQVRIFGLHSDDKNLLPTENLPWALPILPITSASISGIGQTPVGIVNGSHVCIQFMDMYQQQPVMIGTLAGVPLLNTSSDLSNNADSQSLVGINSYEKNAKLTKEAPDSINTSLYHSIFPKVLENCTKWGITAEEKIKYVTASIMAIAGGECGFQEKGLQEGSYYSSPTNLVQTFRVFKTTSDAMPYIKMKDKATFFEKVYGVDSGKGKELGNTKKGDGGKYYGRGLIQITGKGMYQSITDILKKRGYNVDFVQDPDSIISTDNIVPATFAFFEKKGLFKNIDNIGFGWFEVALTATGKDANGGYAKKRHYYKQILQVDNIQSMPTNLKVGAEGALSYDNIKTIQERQEQQAKNLVEDKLKDFKSDFVNDSSITQNLFNLQNNVQDKLDEEKNMLKESIKKSFLTDSGDSIFNSFSNFASNLRFVNDNVNDPETNKIIESINNEISATQDDIIKYTNGVIEKAKNDINDFLNVNKLLDDYVFSRIDSLIENARNQIQTKALMYSQKLVRKLNEPIDRINNAINQSGINLSPQLRQLLNRVRIPNAEQLLTMNPLDIGSGVNELIKNIANNIGYSQEQLMEMMNERTINRDKGFLDPTGKYPLRQNYGEPATNRLARGKFDGTVVEWKQNTSLKNIPIGGVNNDEFLNDTKTNNATWSVPSPSLGGQYPYTKVNQSESGHVFIIDDTPEKETISINHRSGTYDDTYSNGVNVKRIVGDSYQIVDRNGYIYISGRATINIMDGANVYINGNCYLDTQGSFNLRASGGINLDTESDVNIKAKGNINLQSLNTTLKSTETTRIKSEQSMFLESAQFMSVKSIDMLSVQSQSSIALRSVQDMIFNSLQQIDMNSKEDLLLSSLSDVAIQSTSRMTFKTDANLEMQSNALFINSANNCDLMSKTLKLTGSNNASINSGGDVAIDGSMLWLACGRASNASITDISKFNPIQLVAIEPINIPDLKMSIFFTPPAMSMPQMNTPSLDADNVNVKFTDIKDKDESDK